MRDCWDQQLRGVLGAALLQAGADLAHQPVGCQQRQHQQATGQPHRRRRATCTLRSTNARSAGLTLLAARRTPPPRLSQVRAARQVAAGLAAGVVPAGAAAQILLPGAEVVVLRDELPQPFPVLDQGLVCQLD